MGDLESGILYLEHPIQQDLPADFTMALKLMLKCLCGLVFRP